MARRLSNRQLLALWARYGPTQTEATNLETCISRIRETHPDLLLKGGVVWLYTSAANTESATHPIWGPAEIEGVQTWIEKEFNARIIWVQPWLGIIRSHGRTLGKFYTFATLPEVIPLANEEPADIPDPAPEPEAPAKSSSGLDYDNLF